MIQNARLLGGTSGSGDKIRYDISSAEQLGSHLEPRIEEGSVDLITAATAAHCKDSPHDKLSLVSLILCLI
jgi:trans-aconitate 3-methyltransferase